MLGTKLFPHKTNMFYRNVEHYISATNFSCGLYCCNRKYVNITYGLVTSIYAQTLCFRYPGGHTKTKNSVIFGYFQQQSTQQLFFS